MTTTRVPKYRVPNRRTRPLSERLAAKSIRRGGCLIWTGATSERGYGVVYDKVDGVRVHLRAHRAAWALANGPIPPGMQVDHICHTKLCIEPRHLRLVNNKQNQENQVGLQSNNRSGIRGVWWMSQRQQWQAAVMHNGVSRHAGFFDDLDEAAAAVRAKRLELFTHNDADRQDVAPTST